MGLCSEAMSSYQEACKFMPAFESPVALGNSQQGFHLRVKPELGKGYAEMLEFRGGIIGGRVDYVLKREVVTHYNDQQYGLSLRYLLDGWMDIRIPQMNLDSRHCPDDLWMAHQLNAELEVEVPGHQMLRGISIDVPLEVLKEWLEHAPEQLHQGLLRVVTTPNEPPYQVKTKSPKLKAIAQRIMSLDNADWRSRIQFEALTLEFLAVVLSSNLEAQLPRRQASGNRRQALDKAVEILSQEWVAPPTISQLARQVGINELYLKNDFRDTFGCTIGGFVRTQRMNKAHQLISEQGLTVKEAALTVGFSNLGHFSSVFKQYYGQLPSDLRTSG